jgi:predicted HicB family RNase H-like nuclease
MLSQAINVKAKKIKEVADALYAAGPDWITFYKEVCGLDGVIRQQYPTLKDLEEFEQTEVYQQIQYMLTQLRQVRPTRNDSEEEETEEETAKEEEPTKVITVRIPKSLHEALRNEAYEHHTSMNKLCISKLLQIVDQERVPRMS